MNGRPGAAATGEHVPVLDGVRGLAIVLVMCVHFVGDARASSVGERVAVKLANYGVWGVDLFFVLSGFLITGILLRSKPLPAYFRNFYVRRVLRIFPLYYGVLFFLFVVLPALPVEYPPRLAQSAAHAGWVWSYGTNLFLAHANTWSLPYVGHFWSLAIEEHFYLVWPLLVFLVSVDQLVVACWVVGLLSLSMRIGLALTGSGEMASLVLTPCRLDSLCAGALFATLVARDGLVATSALARRACLPAALFTLAASAYHACHLPGDTVALACRGTALAAFFGTAIVASTASPSSARVHRAFASAPMRLLGRYSYGLYVFHGIVAYAMYDSHVDAALDRALGSHVASMVAFALSGALASFAISAFSYELFERHFLRLKDRLAPAIRPEARRLAPAASAS